MNEINCIFCDLPGDRVVIEENGYSGRKCSRCGLIFVSPRPSLGEIVDLYGHDDAHLSADEHIGDAYTKRLYARHHLRIIRRFVTRGDVLEIGSGAGYFLDEARAVGFRPFAIEFNPAQARHIRETLGLPCEATALSPSIFGGQRFDLIYHSDVISHFYDPILEFQRMNEVLREGGYIILETGNLGDVDPAWLGKFERFQYPDHLFFYSVANLETLCARSGFAVEAIYRFSIVPQLWMMRTLSRSRSARRSTQRSTQRSTRRIAPEGPPRTAPTNRSRTRGALRRAYEYTSYALRYGAGRVFPRNDAPQTVILVARKPSS